MTGVHNHVLQTESKEEALRKLFVGGLPRSTTDDDFKNYFSQFGEVVDSIVLKDNNGNSKYAAHANIFNVFQFQDVSTSKLLNINKYRQVVLSLDFRY